MPDRKIASMRPELSSRHHRRHDAGEQADTAKNMSRAFFDIELRHFVLPLF